MAGSVPAERLSAKEKKLLEDLLSGAVRIKIDPRPATADTYQYAITIANESASRTLWFNQMRTPPAFKSILAKVSY